MLLLLVEPLVHRPSVYLQRDYIMSKTSFVPWSSDSDVSRYVIGRKSQHVFTVATNITTLERRVINAAFAGSHVNSDIFEAIRELS
jgi:hypothetical protein